MDALQGVYCTVTAAAYSTHSPPTTPWVTPSILIAGPHPEATARVATYVYLKLLSPLSVHYGTTSDVRRFETSTGTL